MVKLMPDSFYDIKGNEVSKDGIVSEFINNYTGSVTDFNEGSEIRNLLEAFAVYAMGNEERMNDLLYAVDIMNADGEYLDLLASQPRIDMERIEGVEARGEVIFTVQNALLEELSIPAGTIVTAENGMEFETITDNILPAGALSIPCMVEAIEVGTDGNIPANSIITKIDGYDAVQGFSVSNEDAFSGGLDYEEDDVFRDRIIEHMSLQKFGSEPYYKATLANEYPEAHDILFDTSSSTYTAVITPNTYKGSEAQLKLVNDIHAFLSDANNILLGHSFNVVSPQSYIKTVNIYFQDTASSNNGLYVKLANYDTDTVNKAKEVLNCFLKGGAVSFGPHEFQGLNLTQEFTVSNLEETLSTCLGDLFKSLTEVGNVHVLNSYLKYGWNYV
jgi:hypothetical protein